MENIVQKQNTIEDELSLTEKIKQETIKKIQNAENNPISTERIVDLENQIKKITDDFIERGHPSPEDILKEDSILIEIMKSSAMAYNIVEFKELLKQISEKYELGKKWADDLLAHENAHANVLGKQGAIWKGYGVVFIKDESGALSNLQPLNFSRSNPEWGPKQTVINSIESTNAPLEYGEALSEGDNETIKLEEGRLERIKQNEERISQIKAELGAES